jgi:hypothetical protein
VFWRRECQSIFPEDKTYSTLLDQNPPFELRPETGFASEKRHSPRTVQAAPPFIERIVKRRTIRQKAADVPLAQTPLQQGIWRLGVRMMFEHAFDFGSDRNRLHRIS